MLRETTRAKWAIKTTLLTTSNKQLMTFYVKTQASHLRLPAEMVTSKLRALTAGVTEETVDMEPRI